MVVLAILKQKPVSSRGEIADIISKTVRTIQRALDSLEDKGHIQRIDSKQELIWEILKYFKLFFNESEKIRSPYRPL